MGAETEIAWTDHTFNPWWGCTRVSPGCEHCYAEAFDRRVGGAHWGPGKARRIFGAKHWHEPIKWNAAAEKAGHRARVFCASMADVFDPEAPAGELARLWDLIRATPHLDWQLLTKRPERIAASLPADWGAKGYPNVWLGCTAEDQRRLNERLPHLRSVPARVRFLSCEPLLEAIRLPPVPGIDWLIVGGESGGGARPFDLSWGRQLIEQCSDRMIACFVKQLGTAAFDRGERVLLRGKADRPAFWPDDLCVQDFPT